MTVTAEAAGLRRSIRNAGCTDCVLHEDAQTVCLTGDGPVPAKLMILGEAPGWNEDEMGLPFVGAAGKLLDRELRKVGIQREDVFVSNVVKCRPPENRAPTLTEIKACRKYLDGEYAAVKPEVVLLTGNSALRSIGQSGIMKKRGAAIAKDGRIYFPTVHPAAVLRNPALAEGFQNDLQALKRLLDGTSKPPETKTTVIRTAGDLGDFLMMLDAVETPIVPDVETGTLTGRKRGGLDMWAPDWRLFTLGLSWIPGESWVIPLEHPEQEWEVPMHAVYTGIYTALRRKRLVNHNIKFDLQCLRMKGMPGLKGHFDTLIAAHLLDENRSNGLKPLARSLLGADLYEEDIDYDGITPLQELAEYNGKDTDYTLRLYHIFRQQLIESPRLARIFKFISMPACNALVDIELRGFPVDLRRLKTRHAEITEKIIDIETQLLAQIPTHMQSQANFSSSSNFLPEWLFGTLKLPIIKVSAKTNKPSTDEEVLLEIRDRHPVIPLLLELRKWTKWESTYTRNWITKLKLAGVPRLYPNYNITGTVTGRLSSNFQQIPRDPYIRSIIGAPPGWKLIDADFSQIELRIAAMVSGDPTMLAAYQRGDDLHMVTAMAITGKSRDEISKEERSRAKPVAFGYLYGMGWRKYIPYARAQYGIEVTDEESQHYRTSFFLRYPQLQNWHERQRNIVRNLSQVTSPIGRVRRLMAVRSSDPDVAAEAERQAINSPVQGFASDLALLAMSILEDRLDNTTCRILGNLHDSIILEVMDEHAEQTAQIVKEVMETLPIQHLFGYRLPVPIVADVSIVQHWSGQ